MAKEKRLPDHESIWALREDAEARKAKLLSSLFDLRWKAMTEADPQISPEAKARLSDREYSALYAAEAVAFVEAERNRVKEEYLTVDAELLAACELRAQQIREFLSPQSSTPGDLAVAMSLSEDLLLEYVTAAYSAGGDMAEEGLRLALSVAQTRGYQMVEDRISALMEYWGELLAELAVADELPEVGEAAEKFEMLAADVPDQHQILSAKQSGMNRTAML